MHLVESQQSVCKRHCQYALSLLRCNFPYNCFVAVQTGLKSESEHKRNESRAGANGRTSVASQAAANVSLLAR